MKAVLFLFLSFMVAGCTSNTAKPNPDRTARVVVEFVINEQGQPEDIHVVSSTDPAFNEPAIHAVRKRHFKPVIQNDRPVKMRTSQLFEFNLGEGLNNPPPIKR
jgi:TonB family protein